MCVRAHTRTYRELALLMPTSTPLLLPLAACTWHTHVSGEPWVKDLSTSVAELALVEKADYDKAVGIALADI